MSIIMTIIFSLVACFAFSTILYAVFAFNSKHDPEQIFDLSFKPSEIATEPVLAKTAIPVKQHVA